MFYLISAYLDFKKMFFILTMMGELIYFMVFWINILLNKSVTFVCTWELF